MANPHRTNVLLTSCLKAPVDPHTKAPLASYERGAVLTHATAGQLDNRDYEKEVNTCLKIFHNKSHTFKIIIFLKIVKTTLYLLRYIETLYTL